MSKTPHSDAMLGAGSSARTEAIAKFEVPSRGHASEDSDSYLNGYDSPRSANAFDIDSLTRTLDALEARVRDSERKASRRSLDKSVLQPTQRIEATSPVRVLTLEEGDSHVSHVPAPVRSRPFEDHEQLLNTSIAQMTSRTDAQGVSMDKLRFLGKRMLDTMKSHQDGMQFSHQHSLFSNICVFRGFSLCLCCYYLQNWMPEVVSLTNGCDHWAFLPAVFWC
jgi:hypothetical protein